MAKKLSISIITLFPEFVEHYKDFGIIKKAIKNRLLRFEAVNLRNFALDRRGTVDDRPFGGGVGMVLRPDVVLAAIDAARKSKSQITNIKQKPKSKILNPKTRVILLTPQGKSFKQKDAIRLAKYDHLVFLSGRYEGFDERIRQFVDEEISIGDYVLMGGELPALVVTEAVLRLHEGVIGKLESTKNESFAEGLLEYPQYTKPEILRAKGTGLRAKERQIKVPAVLRSGNHAKINAWRAAEALKRTKKRRPDLLIDQD